MVVRREERSTPDLREDVVECGKGDRYACLQSRTPANPADVRLRSG